MKNSNKSNNASLYYIKPLIWENNSYEYMKWYSAKTVLGYYIEIKKRIKCEFWETERDYAIIRMDSDCSTFGIGSSRTLKEAKKIAENYYVEDIKEALCEVAEPNGAGLSGQPLNQVLPCPFCGGDARDEEWDITSGYFYRVTCTGCGATSGRFSYSIEALSAWNRRAVAAHDLLTSDDVDAMQEENRHLKDMLASLSKTHATDMQRLSDMIDFRNNAIRKMRDAKGRHRTELARRALFEILPNYQEPIKTQEK